jgi:hypothetical protein
MNAGMRDRTMRLAAPIWGRIAARRSLRAAAAQTVVHAPSSALRPALRSLARDCESVLDIGTGLMDSLADSPCKTRIGLDAHRPYLEHRPIPDVVPVNASATELELLFVPGAVDLVTMIDVIEHFDRDAAVDVLAQARRVARRRVVVFTPRGEFPQSGYDAFGMGGEEYQRHRSTWEPGDFADLGMSVVILDRFHGPWNDSFVEAFGADAEPRDALLAWTRA